MNKFESTRTRTFDSNGNEKLASMTVYEPGNSDAWITIDGESVADVLA